MPLKIENTPFGYSRVMISVSFLLANIVYKNFIIKILIKSSVPFFQIYATSITSITGALLDFLGIMILNFVYPIIAKWVNDRECYRTQTQYDDALSFKMFWLQFVNYFLSFFYLAFIRGQTAPLPGDEPKLFQSISCQMGDCLYDLFLQLLIVFTGKQVNSFIQESLIPWGYKSYQRYKFKKYNRVNYESEDNIFYETFKPNTIDKTKEKQRWLATLNMCRNDLILNDPGDSALFPEYLEMMLQYGFITLFVAAFPLAPFFALLNNLFEIRQDAKKFLNDQRRPVPIRAKNIGIWFSFLNIISSLSIRTNALIIAITSQFIQRIVYQVLYNLEANNLDGYLHFSLSSMDITRFQNDEKLNQTTCSYFDYRTGPYDPLGPYRLTTVFWHIFAAKFMFVLAFENLVIIIKDIIETLVPDLPSDLKVRMMLENKIIQDIVMNAKEKKCQRCDQFDKFDKAKYVSEKMNPRSIKRAKSHNSTTSKRTY